MDWQICFFLRFILIGFWNCSDSVVFYVRFWNCSDSVVFYVRFWNCSDSVVFCVFHFIIKGHEVSIVLQFESDSHEVWTSLLFDCNFAMYILKRKLTEIHTYTKLVMIMINGTYPLLSLIQMLILLFFFCLSSNFVYGGILETMCWS